MNTTEILDLIDETLSELATSLEWYSSWKQREDTPSPSVVEYGQAINRRIEEIRMAMDRAEDCILETEREWESV